MESKGDNRRHRRLPIRLRTACNRVGKDGGDAFFMGTTENISTGGVLLKTDHSSLEVGETVSLNMTLPPSSGLLEKGGRLRAYATIKRIHEAGSIEFSEEYVKSVAMQFCDVPSFGDL